MKQLYFSRPAFLAGRSTSFLRGLCATLSLVVALPVARAAITPTGDVSPDPTTTPWDSSTFASVGNTTSGTLTVDSGSDLYSRYAYIGDCSGATGVVTVAGTGSTWKNQEYLYVGREGSGTLNISGGAAVTNNGRAYVAGYAFGNATGTINFGAGGGTLTTASLAASPGQLTGTGTINTRGLVSDVDLVFASAADLTQTLAFDKQLGQDITVNLDMASDPSRNGDLGVGWKGNGSLVIGGGVAVSSTEGYIGYHPGSTGKVTIAGAGATWTVDDWLCVGWGGSGTLKISHGAVVTAPTVCFGYDGRSTGLVSVDGAGSALNYRYAGWQDGAKGTLVITGGGTVTADPGDAGPPFINENSLLAIDVGKGSRFVVNGGTGTIYNYGTVRIVAGAGVTAGETFKPISAATWNDSSGTYQAVGGTWDATNHVFTASDVKAAAIGSLVSFDLSTKQRVLFNGGATGMSAGVSFLATTSPTTLSMTAAPIGGDTLIALASLLESDQTILDAWQFNITSGYTTGDPAYLSFNIGAGRSRNDLEIWHYDGSSWTEFDAADLTYDGMYASFTVTSFSGYAVTTVPEPGTLGLVLAAAVGLFGYGRRKRMKDQGLGIRD